ncbi:hypothetical protein G9A89_023009 [Geosiphon pyriformis]|nr:hypothetical protein G9A89_023009 [Geosiphon pyriformis]
MAHNFNETVIPWGSAFPNKYWFNETYENDVKPTKRPEIEAAINTLLEIFNKAFNNGTSLDKILHVIRLTIKWEAYDARGILLELHFNQTNAARMTLAGFFYERIMEVLNHKLIAYKYYKKAANMGDMNGAVMVGRCYEWEIGTNENFQSAFYWYKYAANRGNPEAYNQLARCYLERTPNKRNVVICLEKSAQGGNLLASRQLALYSKNGIGTNIDIFSAIKFCTANMEKNNENEIKCLLSTIFKV